jgi:predicted transcriptional regulator
MAQINMSRQLNTTQLKFMLPEELKRALQLLAAERNITLSALLRLILSEYVKRHPEL